MKLTKKDIIDHLEQYPDDYELNLSHYFLVEVSPATKGRNKGKPKFVDAMVNLPITGTAADADAKEIRFVLQSSSDVVMKRIEEGGVHPLPEAPEVANDEDVSDEKAVASA